MYGEDVIVFRKKGSEIKDSAQKRCSQLRARLERRNENLEALMDDKAKLRSYLILSVEHRYGMHEGSGELRGQDEISSEEIDEINQLCKRIKEIEAELYRLQLMECHLEDDKEFNLSIHELVQYGFDVK